VINAINFARVPQYAIGKYPISTQPPSPLGGRDGGSGSQQSADFTAAVEKFTASVDKLQKGGIKGNWSLFDLEKIQNDKASIQSNTTR
jgi:hypothetical protein